MRGVVGQKWRTSGYHCFDAVSKISRDASSKEEGKRGGG